MNLRIRFISNIRWYSRWNQLDSEEPYIILSKRKPTSKKANEYHKNVKLPPVLNKRIKTTIFGKRNDKNFKKLEFLGDSYIEFIISVLLFEKYPHFNNVLLIENLMMLVNNRNLSELSKIFKLINIDADYDKSNADLLEAYFGGIALENCLNTYYGTFSRNIWINWNSISLLFLNNLNTLCANKRDLIFNQNNDNYSSIEHSDILLMRLKNNRYKDVKEIFNLNDMNDIDKKIEIERLQFLGTSALKFFITKLYNDYLTSFTVSELAKMRDISLKDDKIIQLTDEYLKKPSYSILYSIFNKKNPKSKFSLNSSHLKQYLGYLVSTHFCKQFNSKNQKLFEIGWIECEYLIKSIYNDYMMSKINVGTSLFQDNKEINKRTNNKKIYNKKGSIKFDRNSNQKDIKEENTKNSKYNNKCKKKTSKITK